MIDLLLNLPTPLPQPGQGRSPSSSAGADFGALLDAHAPPDESPFPAHERESALPGLPTAMALAPHALPAAEPTAAATELPPVSPPTDRVRSSVVDTLPSMDLGPRPMTPGPTPHPPSQPVSAQPPRPHVPNIPTVQDAPPRPRLMPSAPTLPDVASTTDATPLPPPPVAAPDAAVIDRAMPSPRPVIAPPAIVPPVTRPTVALEPRFESSLPALPVVPAAAEAIPPQLPERHQAGTAIGLVDWLSLPWRLKANAGLSYLHGRAALNPGQVAAQSVTISTPCVPSTAGQGAALIVNNAQTRIDERLDALRQLLAQLDLPTPSVDHDWCGTSGGPVRGGGLLASLLWPQRLLRWRANASGEGAVAWVRDFSLDPSQAQPLVDSILALAQDQGLTLQRIMLNGHEVWSSDTSNT